MPLTLLLHAGGGDTTPWRDAFARHIPEAVVHDWPCDDVADYAAVWAPPRALFEGRAGLRAVFSLGAGVDHMLPVMEMLRGTRLLRIEDAGMADQMVEYALHGVLSHQRRMFTYAAQQRGRAWVRHPARSRASVTVGVLGLGVLGGAVARALAAFGYTVRGWSRRGAPLEGVAVYAGDAAFGDFLAGCEVLIDMLPLTPATENLLRRETLTRLPRGATLINLARGRHVVDDDLLALLDEGHLGAAVLDVFRGEPLAAEHPLWSHPRVVVTPHVAALSLPDGCAAQVAEKIRRIERGLPVTGEVDLDAGY